MSSGTVVPLQSDVFDVVKLEHPGHVNFYQRRRSKENTQAGAPNGFEGESLALPAAAQDDDVPRGKLGFAFAHRPGHCVWIRPLTDAVEILDAPLLHDSLAASALYRPLNFAFRISVFGMILSSVPAPLCLPIAALRFTNATQLFLNLTEGEAPPWGDAFDEFSVVVSCLGATSFICFALYTCLMYHPGVLRLIWEISRIRLVITLSTAVVYACATFWLLPNWSHGTWIVARTMFVLNSCFRDAISVANRLRFTDTRFAEVYGTKKRRSTTFWVILFAGCFLLSDVFRHFLVQWTTPEESLIGLNFRNPVTDNVFGLSSHNLANSCFVTNIVFTGVALWLALLSHIGAETILLSTRFVIESV